MASRTACPATPSAKVAEWLSKSANEIHQGPWMARAKVRRPDAVDAADEHGLPAIAQVADVEEPAERAESGEDTLAPG